jgi:GTPase
MSQLPLKLPRIVIVGRPNVGKSTLFNRICGRRRALVGNEPGMTRDRLYGRAEWLGKEFEVVDTGGMIPDEEEQIPSEIFRQTRKAIEESAQLVLVVDAREGIVPLDEELAQMLRRTGKPLALAANKIDSLQQVFLAAEFERLGIRDLFPVSAEHGFGVDGLLNHITAPFTAVPIEADDDRIPEEGAQAGEGGITEEPSEEGLIRVAIIGRPNVGKSTLLNQLLGEERSIVTPIAGTTRDAVDAEFEHNGVRFRLIDTAGIRRKGKTKLLAEKLSVVQARRHLERADVALVVLDALKGVTAVDTHIAGYAHESGRSVVIVLNKWDAVRNRQKAAEQYAQTIRRRLKYLDYAPVAFVSALKGQKLDKLLATVEQVATARRKRIPTAEINRFNKELDLERAPSPAGKRFRIYYLTQAGVAPPTFVAFINRTGKLHFSVERHIENRLRERFGFIGTPIVVKARESR